MLTYWFPVRGLIVLIFLQYPSFFSAGLVYSGGPPKQVIDKQRFEVHFWCKGYSKSKDPAADGREPDVLAQYLVTGPGRKQPLVSAMGGLVWCAALYRLPTVFHLPATYAPHLLSKFCFLL